MSTASLQPSSEIRRLTPLVQRGMALRGDVAWFVPLYALLLAWLLARRTAAQVVRWGVVVVVWWWWSGGGGGGGDGTVVVVTGTVKVRRGVVG